MRLRRLLLGIMVLGATGVLASNVWDGSKVIPLHKVNLKDEEGLSIVPGEKNPMPFSARTSCGACHDYAKISHGWHFSSEADLNGRASEPWVIVDEKSGTQLPVSLRESSGLKGPEMAGMSNWEFVMNFGRHMPGGSVGEGQSGKSDETVRWDVSGDLEINCLACHNGSKCQDLTEWALQVARQNFRWAATASSGIGEVKGVVARMKDSWVPSDGFNPDDLWWNVPPTVQYNKKLFDSKHRVIMDIVKPGDARCLQCHSTAQVGKEKKEVTCDIHTSSGMSCVSCHRNGLDHKIDRGIEGMYSCEGCHSKDGGTYGAPVPKHKGLPEVHLKKLSCTACHSGSVIGENGELADVRTSRVNRLGIHGRAQWFTEAPKMLEPVMVKQKDGKIAPSRIVWPSFWAAKEGDILAPLKAEDVMDKVGDVLDPSVTVGNVLAALTSVNDSNGNPYGKPVFAFGGKVYERNFDGGLDVIDFKGKKLNGDQQFGFILPSKVVPLPQKVMDSVQKMIDEGEAGAPAVLAKIKETLKSESLDVEPVYLNQLEPYALNSTGGLDKVEYKGSIPTYEFSYGYIEENVIDSLTAEYNAKDMNTIWEVMHQEKHLPHIRNVIDALKKAVPEGMDVVWQTGKVKHYVKKVAYETVSKEEAEGLFKTAKEAAAAVQKKADELGVVAEVKEKKIYQKADSKELRVSRKKTPELYALKKLMVAQSEAEYEADMLESFGGKYYRNTYQKDIPEAFIVKDMAIDQPVSSRWGWSKGDEFVPFISDKKAQVIFDTVGGDDVVFTENQVAMALDKLGAGHVYVCRGKVFSSDGNGGLNTEDHKDAEPVTWPIAHDVRPASQSLGAKDCKECHGAGSGFFFASITPQGALVSDKIKSVSMHEFMDADEDLHILYGRAFKFRQVGTALGLGVCALLGAIFVLFMLDGLSCLLKIISGRKS